MTEPTHRSEPTTPEIEDATSEPRKCLWLSPNNIPCPHQARWETYPVSVDSSKQPQPTFSCSEHLGEMLPDLAGGISGQFLVTAL